jgi:hypothetical protein
MGKQIDISVSGGAGGVLFQDISLEDTPSLVEIPQTIAIVLSIQRCFSSAVSIHSRYNGLNRSTMTISDHTSCCIHAVTW